MYRVSVATKSHQHYEIFEKCADAEEIPFWKDFFRKCSVGSFPPGVTYKENVIYYRKQKRGPHSVFYIPFETEEAIAVMKKFATENIGILSIDESKKKAIKMKKALENNMIKTDLVWKTIRSRITKERLLDAYIRSMSDHLKLDAKQEQNLRVVICFGVSTGNIPPENIKLKNAEIINIEGIRRDKNGIFYVKSITTEDVVFTAKPLKKQHQISCVEKWDKVITQYADFVKMET